MEQLKHSAESLELRAIWDSAGLLATSLACSAAFLVIFAWLSEEVFEGDLRRFDLGARARVHELFSPQVTKFMEVITFLGAVGFLSALFAVVVAVLLLRKLKRSAAWLAIAVIGSAILDLVLKFTFQRPRPVPFVGKVPLTYSFPSGHALSSFCFYGALAGILCAGIQSRGLRILIWTVSAVLVLAIGLSRIYLGVHYPTDVIAGYIAAAAWVSAMLFAMRIQYLKSQNFKG